MNPASPIYIAILKDYKMGDAGFMGNMQNIQKDQLHSSKSSHSLFKPTII